MNKKIIRSEEIYFVFREIGTPSVETRYYFVLRISYVITVIVNSTRWRFIGSLLVVAYIIVAALCAETSNYPGTYSSTYSKQLLGEDSGNLLR